MDIDVMNVKVALLELIHVITMKLSVLIVYSIHMQTNRIEQQHVWIVRRIRTLKIQNLQTEIPVYVVRGDIGNWMSPSNGGASCANLVPTMMGI